MTGRSGRSDYPCTCGGAATSSPQRPWLGCVGRGVVAALAWVRRDSLWPNLQATIMCLGLALLGYLGSIVIPSDYAARQAAVQANAEVIAEWRIQEFTTARELQTEFADEIPKNTFLLRAMAIVRAELEALRVQPGETDEQFRTRFQAEKTSRLTPLVERWLERPGYLALCLAVRSRFHDDAISERAMAIAEICGLMNEIGPESGMAATSTSFRAILDRTHISDDVSGTRPSFPIGSARELADAMTAAVESILARTVEEIHGAIQRMEPRAGDERRESYTNGSATASGGNTTSPAQETRR